MQRATVNGVRLGSPADARVIFHSVFLSIMPMVTRRLNTEEKRQITTGSVYVWEEKGPYAKLPGAGIERWTDGIGWGPSRLRDGFLLYREQPALEHLHTENLPPRSLLNKKTYSVYIDVPGGRRKWHLVAYFTDETVGHLRDIYDIPQLANLAVPHTKYQCARIGKGTPEPMLFPESDSRGIAHLECAPYVPMASPPIPFPTPQHHLDPWPNALLRHGSVPRRSGAASANSSDDVKRGSLHGEGLVPLSYLQCQPYPYRHPADEKMLRLLHSRGFCNNHTRPL
ncbi:hypothetical protein GALMADRAFT_68004 [Galerina marginata CBS 339.88]|uniref:Gti1/Pac2 family-domain-containing protein n=1 Tax=Galerina marginata (strain CBS 339.88) TaxID=685588 RepID=A0A067T858_GALM3|nr:hypothetical protein GALMADRAFT_68004 [Galerina marginata CBS 339.88]